MKELRAQDKSEKSTLIVSAWRSDAPLLLSMHMLSCCCSDCWYRALQVLFAVREQSIAKLLQALPEGSDSLASRRDQRWGGFYGDSEFQFRRSGL